MLELASWSALLLTCHLTPSLEASHAELIPWWFDLFSSIALLHTSAQLVPPSLTTSFHHTSLRPSIFIMPLFLQMKHFHQPLTPFTPIDMFCHRILKTNSFNPSCKAAPLLTEPDFFPSHPHMLALGCPFTDLRLAFNTIRMSVCHQMVAWYSVM